MNSLDARARYTRSVIEENFLFLLEQKPIAKITVTELCQRAGINRATFYKHYLDIPYLMEHLEKQFFERLQAFLDTRLSSRLETIVLDVLSYIRQDGKRYFALASNDADPEFFAKTFQVCYQKMFPALIKRIPDMGQEQAQILYYYLSHGSGGVLAYWLRSNMALEPEALAHMIVDICSGTVHSFLGVNAGRKEK